MSGIGVSFLCGPKSRLRPPHGRHQEVDALNFFSFKLVIEFTLSTPANFLIACPPPYRDPADAQDHHPFSLPLTRQCLYVTHHAFKTMFMTPTLTQQFFHSHSLFYLAAETETGVVLTIQTVTSCLSSATNETILNLQLPTFDTFKTEIVSRTTLYFQLLTKPIRCMQTYHLVDYISAALTFETPCSES